MTLSPERQSLAAAQDDLRAAIDNQKRAEEVLKKARDLECALTAQLAEDDSLDADLAQARADRLKLALASGEVHALADEPQGFASRQIGRSRIEAELTAIEQSIPILESELESAREIVARRTFDRDMAAEAVFAQTFGALAEDFNRQLLDIRAQSYMLNVAAYTQVRRDPGEVKLAPGPYYGQGAMRRVNMPQAVNLALQDNCLGLHEQRNGFQLRDKSQSAVLAFWQALQSDPEAQLTMPESNSTPQWSFDSSELKKAK